MTKQNTCLALLCVFSVVLVCVHVYNVQAQEPTGTPLPPSASVKGMYLDVLTGYRTDEQAFIVSKQQYVQVQTLGNLDAAVKAFKQVQMSRTQTATLYLQTLLSTVSEAKGMDLAKKAIIMQKLNTTLSALLDNQSQVDVATDRVGLEATAKTFAAQQKAFEAVTYETLALLRITQMQSAVDQLSVTSDLIHTQIVARNLDATTMAEKQRGFDEVARTINSVKAAILKANQFHDRVSAQSNYTNSSYNQIVSMLNAGYPQLRQADSFLVELAGK
ncbi:MAG TPA: hypothetical protein VFG51_03985 [Candidatus Saccharimonadia bacterium]|nr:hypothetical protein [Candidatus Saccharimonadia bacterium]